MRPPPGPVMPGIGVFSPAGSPQQAVESLVLDSSSVMISSPSCWNAGEPVMTGTHFARNASAAIRSPSLVPLAFGPAHGVASWPSLHRFGVIQLKLRVVDTDERSPGSVVSG